MSSPTFSARTRQFERRGPRPPARLGQDHEHLLWPKQAPGGVGALQWTGPAAVAHAGALQGTGGAAAAQAGPGGVGALQGTGLSLGVFYRLKPRARYRGQA